MLPATGSSAPGEHAPFDWFWDDVGHAFHVDRESGRLRRSRTPREHIPATPASLQFTEFFRAFGAPAWRPVVADHADHRHVFLPTFQHDVATEPGDVVVFAWRHHLVVGPVLGARACLGCVGLRLVSASELPAAAIGEVRWRARSCAGEGTWPTRDADAPPLPAGAADAFRRVEAAPGTTYCRWTAGAGWSENRFLPVPGDHAAHVEALARATGGDA